MPRDRYVPLSGQGHRGITIKLRPLEIEVLAQLGGKHYTRIGDVVRDFLRTALAPRVAALAEGRLRLEHMARARFDDDLRENTADRAARRADPDVGTNNRPVSDEPLVQMTTNVPASDRAAFQRLAVRRGTSASALLRELVRDYVATGA